jgi:hypothetical protein
MTPNKVEAPPGHSMRTSALQRLIRALAVAIACASVFVVLGQGS